MPEEIIAWLSDEISEPELSKMWESERTTFTTGSGDGIDTWLTAPELVIEPHGKKVILKFPSGGPNHEHVKLRAAFERAVHRYRPDVTIEWAARAR